MFRGMLKACETCPIWRGDNAAITIDVHVEQHPIGLLREQVVQITGSRPVDSVGPEPGDVLMDGHQKAGDV